MTAPEIIRCKRDGGTLSPAQIQAFVDGLVSGAWSDAQAAAMAMAVLLRGMNAPETADLTRAMAQSGEQLNWGGAGLRGPLLDKHSTGGVGDKVSLILAPLLAACGAVVPMVSGRGLGHTGGTLDKLEALPGYTVQPSRSALLACLRDAGCAIMGANARLAPADARLYAIRDLTATVESLPLITASILSKKLAAGVQGLVMDVKVGQGAFASTLEDARALARSLVSVAEQAGLPTQALISDMNQPLGCNVGHGLEVAEALAFLKGDAVEPRLRSLTLALGARLLQMGGLAANETQALALQERALNSGAAAERFARMVASLGGPTDVLRQPGLAAAPVVCDVPAPRSGFLQSVDTRALGLAVQALGGGRLRAGDTIDPRVGFSGLLPLGSALRAGEPLAQVHAATAQAAQQAVQALISAYRWGDEAPQRVPLICEAHSAPPP